MEQLPFTPLPQHEVQASGNMHDGRRWWRQEPPPRSALAWRSIRFLNAMMRFIDQLLLFGSAADDDSMSLTTTSAAALYDNSSLVNRLSVFKQARSSSGGCPHRHLLPSAPSLGRRCITIRLLTLLYSVQYSVLQYSTCTAPKTLSDRRPPLLQRFPPLTARRARRWATCSSAPCCACRSRYWGS